VLQDFRPIAEVPELTEATYVPRASTPLLDAIGRGIHDLSGRIVNLPEGERPEHTVFVILTDGHENASREFTKPQIVELIQEAQEKKGWHFTFLSAELEAIQDAVAYGIEPDGVMAFERTGPGTQSAYRSASGRIKDLRTGKAKDLHYTNEDRKAQEELRKQKGN
jgi:hypothetical protein